MTTYSPDVLIIGAGPAGAVAAALLCRQGRQVTVLERQTFPRFVIGESLLPQTMDVLARAGLLPAVEARGFQRKTGAWFCCGDRRAVIDFGAQFTPGYASTFQVPRAEFDQTLADGAAAAGATVRYQHTVTAVEVGDERPRVTATAADGSVQTYTPRFLLDASGYGRVLPRLLGLDRPATLASRSALFCHLTGDDRAPRFELDKITIAVHPTQHDVWYWLIPFSNGNASVGVVAPTEFLARYPADPAQRLLAIIAEEPQLAERLRAARLLFPPRSLTGYSASVSQLWGPQFALLGNAGEFLDPVFSSGVTLAVKSADLACMALQPHLNGQPVDWDAAFARPLLHGVGVFECCVRRWYDGSLQDVIFHPNKPPDMYRMICSILAGYVWDLDNPFCHHTDRRLAALAQLCQGPPP